MTSYSLGRTFELRTDSWWQFSVVSSFLFAVNEELGNTRTIGHFRWMSIIRVFPSSSLTATKKDETIENCFDIGIWSFGQLWPFLHGYKSYSTLCTKCSALYLSKTALIKHSSYWRNYATGMINLSMESLFVMWNGRGVIVEADIRLSEELATEGCS